jgi:predicted CXXCH cytochrome family protein
MAKLFRENPVLHGPVASGNCSSCHNPHRSPNANLLLEPYPPEFYAPFSEDRYRLCFQCHLSDLVLQEKTTLTRFRQGTKNLHFIHVNDPKKGRTCRVCHEVHASKLPFHMREWVPFGPQKWKLEIHYTMSEEGGSCAPGCHQPREYRWSSQGTGEQ